MTFLQTRMLQFCWERQEGLSVKKKKKMAPAAFCWWKISIPFAEKQEERGKGVELLQSCVFYSPPSDLLLWLTTVLKGREWNLNMHWIYKCTLEKRLRFLLRTGSFAIKVSSFLALMLLYITGYHESATTTLTHSKLLVKWMQDATMKESIK